MSSIAVSSSTFKTIAVNAENATIPMFNLVEIEESTGEKRQGLLKGLVCAFETIGFAALYVPHLNRTHEKIFSEAHKFFSLKEEEKRRFSKDGFGYVPYGQEQLRGETIAAERYRYIPSLTTLPEDLPDFSAAVLEIGQQYNKLARSLGALLSEGIGAPNSFPISDTAYTMSIKHYPKPTNLKEGDIVHPHHRDISPITILPSGTEAGLQVLRDDGNYHDILVPEGYVVANTGELLCNKTAGRFFGADHRVVMKGSWPEHGRYQVALFNEFPEDLSLRPDPSLLEEATKEMSSKKKQAFTAQFMTGTVTENLEAYQINVSGQSATAEKLNELIQKGFLRNPSEKLKEKFPDCDWKESEKVNKNLRDEGLNPLFSSSIS